MILNSLKEAHKIVYIECGVIYTIMKLIHSTEDSMFELDIIFCGKTNEIQVYEDCKTRLFEDIIDIALQEDISVRVVKRNPICRLCKKPLACNGTKSIRLNKTVVVKCQKYIHNKCEKSSCISTLIKFKDKYCSYMRSICNKGIIRSLIGYSSYQNKKETLYDQYEVNIPRSTVLYHEQRNSNELIDYLESLQYRRIKEMNIRPSGVYSYDEQYVFIKKELYMRMTLIDHQNKLIMYEYIVHKDDFNDTTIRNFLETAINSQPLKAIITDGRKSYKTIIEATGAIHHRCYFHLMQNLMTPLTKHTNKLKRQNKTHTDQIKKKTIQITNIEQNKKKYIGRVPLKDKKTNTQIQKINTLKKEISTHKNKIRQINKELKKIQYDIERIQNIFTAKTHKQAQQRFNTIHNQRTGLNNHIQHFLEKIRPELEIILNHTIYEKIPRTNNTVENYYRTTLPRNQKRIYKTLKGLKKAIKIAQIRWTHRNVLKETDNINLNTYI